MRSSKLGIVYEEDFPKLPSGLLLLGEEEWLARASETYGVDAGEIWVGELLERLSEAQLREADVFDLQAYCPQMLRRMRFLSCSQNLSEEVKEHLAGLLRQTDVDLGYEP